MSSPIHFVADYNVFGHPGKLVKHEHARLLIAFQPIGWSFLSVWGELDVNPTASYILDGLCYEAGVTIMGIPEFLEQNLDQVIHFRYTPAGIARFREMPETDHRERTIRQLKAIVDAAKAA